VPVRIRIAAAGPANIGVHAISSTVSLMVSRHVNRSVLVATLYDMPFVNELTEVCEAVARHSLGGEAQGQTQLQGLE